MIKKSIPTLLFVIFLLCGCDAALVMNGKIMGVSSGKFIYQDGYLITNYKTDINIVWNACEKAIKDLKATDVQKDRKIATGSIKAIIQDEKVTILVEYVATDLTTVSVIAGMVGNNMASGVIQDKIASYIVMPLSTEKQN
jgi:uncharacterized lipoprotein NlpE involved in copper resistance